MSETEVYKALASRSRIKILGLIYRGPHSVEEISQKTKLKPITVRHHLRYLEDAGFISSYEVRSGSAGRPKVHFRVVKEPTSITFPKRHYLTLLDTIIVRLPASLGLEKTKEILKEIGHEMGVGMVRKLALDHGVEEWSPDNFADIFVMKHLDGLGAEPEVVKISDREVVYRVNNCLFLELAMKHPEMICQVMDEGVEFGVAKTMNPNWKIEKIKCVGMGDDTCEFTLKLK